MERIIVRRGRFLTYELLRRTFGGDPNVEIIWDRRRTENAVAEGGPQADRRGRPPEQWSRLDYLFTNGAPGRMQPREHAQAGAGPDRGKPSSE
jgi:hypothetical protein